MLTKFDFDNTEDRICMSLIGRETDELLDLNSTSTYTEFDVSLEVFCKNIAYVVGKLVERDIDIDEAVRSGDLEDIIAGIIADNTLWEDEDVVISASEIAEALIEDLLPQIFIKMESPINDEESEEDDEEGETALYYRNRSAYLQLDNDEPIIMYKVKDLEVFKYDFINCGYVKVAELFDNESEEYDEDIYSEDDDEDPEEEDALERLESFMKD